MAVQGIRNKVIKRFSNKVVARKLLSMGILPGMKISIVRRAPFGGSLYIMAGSQYIALRKEEFQDIITE